MISISSTNDIFQYTRVNISKIKLKGKKKLKKRRGFKEIWLKYNLGYERQPVICNTSFQREEKDTSRRNFFAVNLERK